MLKNSFFLHCVGPSHYWPKSAFDLYHSKLVVELFKARGVGLDCSTVTVLSSGSPSEFLLKNAISRLLAPYVFARFRLRDSNLAVRQWFRSRKPFIWKTSLLWLFFKYGPTPASFRICLLLSFLYVLLPIGKYVWRPLSISSSCCVGMSLLLGNPQKQRRAQWRLTQQRESWVGVTIYKTGLDCELVPLLKDLV